MNVANVKKILENVNPNKVICIEHFSVVTEPKQNVNVKDEEGHLRNVIIPPRQMFSSTMVCECYERSSLEDLYEGNRTLLEEIDAADLSDKNNNIREYYDQFSHVLVLPMAICIAPSEDMDLATSIHPVSSVFQKHHESVLDFLMFLNLKERVVTTCDETTIQYYTKYREILASSFYKSRTNLFLPESPKLLVM